MNEALIKDIIYLLVGISIFIISMKIMSTGLKKISGKGLKNLFKKTQNIVDDIRVISIDIEKQEMRMIPCIFRKI